MAVAFHHPYTGQSLVWAKALQAALQQEPQQALGGASPLSPTVALGGGHGKVESWGVCFSAGAGLRPGSKEDTELSCTRQS